MQNFSRVFVPSRAPPRFTFETILDFLDVPPSFRDELLCQNDKRHGLRSEVLVVAPREYGGRLPPASPEINSAWENVFNARLPSESHRDPDETFLLGPIRTSTPNSAVVPDLQCSDPKLIAEALSGYRHKITSATFVTAMEKLARHGDLSTAFALQLAKLIAESLRLHVTANPIVAEQARLSVCAIEVANLKHAWVYEHNSNGSCKHIGVTGSSRLVFFSALYKYGAATPTDYAQMLKYLVLGGPPCICRLLALQTVAGSGDQHVHRFCGNDVGLVLDTLWKTDDRGYKVWELGGERKAASEMLQGVLDKIQGWSKA